MKTSSPQSKDSVVTTIREAMAVLSAKPNLGMVSVPGPYATAESLKLLRNGCHVFLFSNNVPIEDEILLKEYAKSKNLLVMGPDCGTSILDGIPLGFANVVRRGRIGLAGASGTGLQAVSSYIHQMGHGCSQVIGVGGRDLSEEVNGDTIMTALKWLMQDPNTDVIALVCKAPSLSVANAIWDVISESDKPVVVNFSGATYPAEVNLNGVPIVAAVTLEDSARMAVTLADPQKNIDDVFVPGGDIKLYQNFNSFQPSHGIVRGLFSGGTLAKESGMIFKSLFKDNPSLSLDVSIVDLGEDEFTLGRAHPMIDFTVRNKWILDSVNAAVETAKDYPKAKTIILLDIVLGYGSHLNPASALQDTLLQCGQILKKSGKTDNVAFVGALCATDMDPQNYFKQERELTQMGILLNSTSEKAALCAAEIAAGVPLLYKRPAEDAFKKVVASMKPRKDLAQKTSNNSGSILSNPSVLNLGLQHFVDPLIDMKVPVTHINWIPPASGDRDIGLLQSLIDGPSKHITQESTAILHKLDNFSNKISKANTEAVRRLLESSPALIGFDLARNVVPNMIGGDKHIITHAGPPVESFNSMCGPMQGAVIGAILNEGWAKTHDEAAKFANDTSKIVYRPCHEHSLVGPMCGVVSPSMPVAIIENAVSKNRAYAPLNEGLGRVLRFGANDDTVLKRLRFMKEILFPALQNVMIRNGPIDIKSILAQGLSMGDEGHNRVAACTLIFANQITAGLAKTCPPSQLVDVVEFLGANAHFFLNLSMAACKSALDTANGIEYSTMMTVMARNGVDFGIKISGTNLQWHTSPALAVKGLYFSGYGPNDANPDLGDSAITETAGIGGFAMAAAPNIVKFVGGTVSDAFMHTSNMRKITLATNNNFSIPILNGQGTPTGIDIRAVLDTGILPVINTGIAHKLAGVGQIGAGITTAPPLVFHSAIKEFAKLHGVRYYHSYSITSRSRLDDFYLTLVRRNVAKIPSVFLRMLK